jgi:hypothetical protein
MPPPLVQTVIIVGAAGLWLAGLRLFIHSGLSLARKVGWATFLVGVGIGAGAVLPLSQVWTKFVLLVMILPLLAVADVFLLRSRRGFSFWIRACGFEVCTVFGAAAAARLLLDMAGGPVPLRILKHFSCNAGVYRRRRRRFGGSP